MAGKLDYLVPVGILKKTRKFVAGHQSLKKIFHEVLNWLNVPFADECCDSAADSAPVRYNIALNRLEVYAGGAWVDVNNIDAVTTTTTTTTSTTTTTTAAPTTTSTTTTTTAP